MSLPSQSLARAEATPVLAQNHASPLRSFAGKHSRCRYRDALNPVGYQEGRVLHLPPAALATYLFLKSENVEFQDVGSVRVRSRWEEKRTREGMPRARDQHGFLCHICVKVICTWLQLSCLHNLDLLFFTYSVNSS